MMYQQNFYQFPQDKQEITLKFFTIKDLTDLINADHTVAVEGIDITGIMETIITEIIVADIIKVMVHTEVTVEEEIFAEEEIIGDNQTKVNPFGIRKTTSSPSWRIVHVWKLNSNNNDFISIPTNFSETELQILVDSQGDISVVKESAIEHNKALDVTDIIYIKGITDQIVPSLGTIHMEMKLGNEWIVHKVHVVPDNFEIPVHGLLGKDFLKIFQCNLDYATMILTVNTPRGSTTLPIFSEDSLIIPPRCEVIRHFKIVGKNSIEDQVIHPTEVAPGVIIARSIFNPNNPYLRVINTTNEPAMIKKTIPKSENLSNYYVFAIDEISCGYGLELQ